jgi:hypothetical protein
MTLIMMATSNQEEVLDDNMNRQYYGCRRLVCPTCMSCSGWRDDGESK